MNRQADRDMQAEMDEEREFYDAEAGVLGELWVNDREAIHLAEVSCWIRIKEAADNASGGKIRLCLSVADAEWTDGREETENEGEDE